MKVIIHDLQEKLWQELGVKFQEKDIVIGRETETADKNMKEMIESCRQLVLISRCVYGGFSPSIQNVLTKFKEQFGPFLELRNGQTHYKIKNENKNAFGMICCFYGDDITPEDEQSARIQSVSDGISLRARAVKIVFYDTTDKLRQLNKVFV